MNNRNLVIIFWISVAILAASIEPIIVKLGYCGTATPMQLLVLKSLVGSLLILPLTRTWRWIGWRGVRTVLIVSLLLLTTNALTLFALKSISAVTVITVLTTTPAVVALLNQKLGRDILGRKFWLGFAMCLLGILLGLDMHELSFAAVGLLQIFGAVISSTIYRVRMEDTTAEFSPALVSTYIFLINGILTALFIAPWVGMPSSGTWVMGAWMGIAAAAANVAFLYALHLVGSTRISVVLMIERPVVILAAALILHEWLSIPQMIGVALVLLGIRFATVKRAKQAAVVDSGQSESVAAVPISDREQLSSGAAL
jgi:drug/metabolite transporter (DMT)-like permease